MISSAIQSSQLVRRVLSVLLPASLILTMPLGLASQTIDASRQTLVSLGASGGCDALLASAMPDPKSGQDGSGAGQSGHGFDPANMDRSVSPCDDFFHFADGGWLKANPIPADHSSWAKLNQLRDKNEDVDHAILEDAAKDTSAKPGSNWQKIGDFYASCMDEKGIESAGVKPLDDEFARIADIKDTASLQAEIARLQQRGVNAVFGFGSEQDFKDSTQVIAAVDQGGLGLPDRDYYLQPDDASKKIRDEYVKHVANMFVLLGDDPQIASNEAGTVLNLETNLANASLPRVDRRDPEKVYHKLSLTAVREMTPNFSWNEYLSEQHAPPVDSINIAEPDFLKQVDADITSIPLADWKVYLRWHTLHSAAAQLPEKFVDENFDFYGRTLTGTTEMRPRWRRCVDATDSQLGEALGQYYVQRNFPPEAKAKALVMVKGLIAALRDDLSTLDWMSPETRKQAIVKLDAMNLKIGYPDKWRDYSAYKVDRGPYVLNSSRGESFEFARDVAKIGKPVDRTEWDMSPPTVNAYYSSTMNEIVFPAGILQPPFFDPKADDAINYGGMGAVIGHEMTHGFDDQGSKFDAKGTLKDWWTPEDKKNFEQRGDCIAKQFHEFEVEPGVHENGKLVEGESIADLGGVTISYAAFQKTLKGKHEPPKIDGFTADQRFFLGFAQIWTGTDRPEIARLYVKTDPHPADQFRANGPLSNTPAFAKAFGCSANSKMVRPEDQRCRIW